MKQTLTGNVKIDAVMYVMKDVWLNTHKKIINRHRKNISTKYSKGTALGITYHYLFLMRDLKKMILQDMLYLVNSHVIIFQKYAILILYVPCDV